jgi:hypothetical protein
MVTLINIFMDVFANNLLFREKRGKGEKRGEVEWQSLKVRYYRLKRKEENWLINLLFFFNVN